MKLFIGIAAAVMMATSAQADPVQTFRIDRQGGYVTIERFRSDTGKEPPKPAYQYLKDGNGNLRDPVTGWRKGNNYGCVNGC